MTMRAATRNASRSMSLSDGTLGIPQVGEE